MVEKLSREAIARHADVHAAVPASAPASATASASPSVIAPSHQVVVNRTFELPRSLYMVTAACYLGFLVITGLGFANPVLIVPIVVMAFVIVAGFGIPVIWTRFSPTAPDKAMSWAKFQQAGIGTVTGHNTAGQASVQVLILPVLILIWGMAVVTIAAMVR